jgi:hypothetical protein
MSDREGGGIVRREVESEIFNWYIFGSGGSVCDRDTRE